MISTTQSAQVGHYVNGTLLIASLMVVAGCATPMSKQISKDTRVSVSSSQADDVLFTQVVVGESAIQGISRRIEKYLAKNLNERGIKTATSDAFKSGDAKLTVKLSTIETVTKSDIGLWAPIVRQQPKIKYTAALYSEDGAMVFTFDDEQDDESIDTLAKKIGERVGGRVARYFK